MQGKVLLIEDEPNIAEAIRFLLTRDGWQVTVLGDGETAERVVQETGPDLVILDFMLPGRSGLDIVAALRARAETVALPVMMLTARGQGRDREAAERAGVTHFMTKPFANAEMLAAVRALVDPATGRSAIRA